MLRDTSSFNIVQTNLIGVAFDGTTPLGNGGNGVEVYTGSTTTSLASSRLGAPRKPGWTLRASRLQKNSGRGVEESAATKTARQPGLRRWLRKATKAPRALAASSRSGSAPCTESSSIKDWRKSPWEPRRGRRSVNKRSSARAQADASAANITPETAVARLARTRSPITSETVSRYRVTAIFTIDQPELDLFKWRAGNQPGKKYPSTEPPSTVTPNDLAMATWARMNYKTSRTF